MTLPTAPPPADPPAVTGELEQRRPGALNGAALVLAALLLIASVAVGIWIIDSAPDEGPGPKADQLVSQAEQLAYGGDAYTGIQNAAADTENSVVSGTNTLAALASALHDDQMSADNQRWGHLWKGLAAPIIGLGALNFTIALQRFGLARARRR